MRFVADTHSLFWYFQDSPKLSTTSKKLFDQREGVRQIVIPTVVLAELLYLYQKISLPHSFEQVLKWLEGEGRFEISSLSVEIIRQAMTLTHLEMHDALIVATAFHLEIPLMTIDHDIIQSQLVATLKP